MKSLTLAIALEATDGRPISGSYMQAPLLQLRIPHTETAIAFLEYSFKERLYYALGALQ